MNFTENSKSVINHSSINEYALKAAKKLKKELNKPERITLEKEFAEKHAIASMLYNMLNGAKLL